MVAGYSTELFRTIIETDMTEPEVEAMLAQHDIEFLPTPTPYQWLIGGMDYPKYNEMSMDQLEKAKRGGVRASWGEGDLRFSNQPTEEFLRERGVTREQLQRFVSRAERSVGRPGNVHTVIREFLEGLARTMPPAPQPLPPDEFSAMDYAQQTTFFANAARKHFTVDNGPETVRTIFLTAFLDKLGMEWELVTSKPFPNPALPSTAYLFYHKHTKSYFVLRFSTAGGKWSLQDDVMRVI
jgi:hypothetical protein